MRISPASIQLAGQSPDLIETLAVADPMIRTMDAILTQLEALAATGNDVFNVASAVPGVATLGRLAGRGAEPTTRKQQPRSRIP
ncbi:hypothetical protein QGN32_23060 [Mycolicibacterium sp. ND9-15]|uniref:hypothetical protein n=1 Tax=Mycolicibacterium sp. ND9-15 TaxID=3042320 RepID=UPI002DDAB902|nr:hypothetical protein [Mycolicibacterium sp. ND9-15]WSE56181.1 hypothetical protein QGN32_23060 [Mycolicibacterium sp. ND9-15]